MSHQAFSRTLSLCRAYKLSSYDAAYLELAIRKSLPIATLDKALKKAAKLAGVPFFLDGLE
jgi:predicted nucleic acid-binding protein